MTSASPDDWKGEHLIRSTPTSGPKYVPKLLGSDLERFRQKRDAADEVREKVRALHAEGLSPRQIAAAVDRSYGNVCSILREAGLSETKFYNWSTRR